MTVAFVLGNGQSRKNIDLTSLRGHGRIYGCNALYRDFEPDVLVAADRAISEQIQHSGYAKTHCFYTRKPIPELGALRVPDPYWGFSSGQIGLALACLADHTTVYLLGYDLGSVTDQFNNVYAGTEFYKAVSARPTYAGNWIKQTIRIAQDFPRTQIVRIMAAESAPTVEFDRISNISHLPLNQFFQQFGS